MRASVAHYEPLPMSENEHDEAPDQQRITPLPPEGLEKFLLRGRRQVRQLLQELIEHRALVSLYLLPGRESFLTAPVTLSDDEEWLYLDASIDSGTNHRATQAASLLCVTQLAHIRIQFSLSGASLTTLGGRAALKAAVPADILRLQRREFYRLPVPLSHPVSCSLPRAEAESRVDVRVIDIGAGGIAIQLPPDLIALELSQELPDCLLRLPEVEPITLSLEVRNIVRQTGRSGIETLRVGCRFATLPRGAETLIQRYIFRADRERSARERGGL